MVNSSRLTDEDNIGTDGEQKKNKNKQKKTIIFRTGMLASELRVHSSYSNQIDEKIARAYKERERERETNIEKNRKKDRKRVRANEK